MSLQLAISDWMGLSEGERAECLSRPRASQDPELRRNTDTIVQSVRSRGDAALRELTARFDDTSIDEFRIDDDAIAAANEQLTPDQVDAIDVAIRNVRRFHEQQVTAPISVETSPGVVCERVSHPLDSVGLYVPAGTAPLPSAAVMLAVPAVLAACPKIILCTPPRPDGSADPGVIVAATRAGVNEIYTLGGAQAIAAMAYGTASIPKVRKIFGPGNAWVTAAKSIVSADPLGASIYLPAGPSEVLVLADTSANAQFVAADLLSQAEHGDDSQVILVSTDRALATAVCGELEKQLSTLPRRSTALAALTNSRIIVVPDVETGISISNEYAPEHLILQIDDARAAVTMIRNAGSVFVGQWTPESVGDYCSGTNHVLPTYGYAASYSGLGLDQFMRQMTVQEVSRDGLRSLAPAIVTLANMEGLDAHAVAVTCRLGVDS